MIFTTLEDVDVDFSIDENNPFLKAYKVPTNHVVSKKLLLCEYIAHKTQESIRSTVKDCREYLNQQKAELTKKEKEDTKTQEETKNEDNPNKGKEEKNGKHTGPHVMDLQCGEADVTVEVELPTDAISNKNYYYLQINLVEEKIKKTIKKTIGQDPEEEIPKPIKIKGCETESFRLTRARRPSDDDADTLDELDDYTSESETESDTDDDLVG